MNKIRITMGVFAAAALAAGCASMSRGPEVTEVLQASFKERGIAKLDRLEQSPLQKACSEAAAAGKDLDKAERAQLEKAALASVKYPADGQYLGDWKEGEKVAQSGRGLQFNDTAQTVAGGNCYACHQLSKAEISFGNIGPSLYHYGKLRGVANPVDPASAEVVKYTWGKVWNSHAYNACSNMPRFGDAGILTESQLKDVMALLLDPKSPVNAQ
ncbi:sulfur oxidation c-type cytochrome SoxX [Schlegelella sp. S2-27]|uniref:Sulfur oxidation c-type cytochrome SoxX n=1 Tax=Caldimonas mangrovi TaxID=2944811 RepID=A0ABT0YRN3_9BURK|nr:sulfur oxidation c-type cytochrome SoxX [Caldimonas mangrovi]MCM5680989.1 sulfur oxidation c-type cytochrome SoxX [Caldimonas mangrovi]